MSRRPASPQNETTPLLTQRIIDDGEGRWSLARRRSSAFLSFLSEPEDKEGEEFQRYHRMRLVYLIVGITIFYNIGIGFLNSYFIEFLQTLACAEYYYPSKLAESPFPTLPSVGDPQEVCSVPWVDIRTSQLTTYADVTSGITSCLGSLVLAKGLLPRFGRRSLSIASVIVTIVFSVLMSCIPTHYSFDPAVPSTSTMHPATASTLFLALYTVANLLGSPQLAMMLLTQVMVLDVVREDEKAAGLSRTFATSTLGMAASSFLLRVVFPFFGLKFSVLRHQGPISPFLIITGIMTITLILILLFLPETKTIAEAKARPRRSSVSTSDSRDDSGVPPATSSLDSGKSLLSTGWQGLKSTLGLFGYFLPYQASPGAKKDYKLPLILGAVIFSDTITSTWSNLAIFCTTHLHFGPEQMSTLLGLLGVTKGMFALFALPWVASTVHRFVKRRMRQEFSAAREELASEDRVTKREESIIYTDRLVAMGSLVADASGFICMGIAAAHLSLLGIYGSIVMLMFATGALPSIQALSIDLFLAQDRPTDNPVAARDAFLGFLNLVQIILLTVGPILNNAIYRWSINHALPATVFFWTSIQSTLSLAFVAAIAMVPK